MNLLPWKRKRAAMECSEPEMPLARLRDEMDALFDRFFGQPFGPGERFFEAPVFPQTDLAESENEVTVTMEVPGVDPKDVSVDVTGHVLTVRGEKRHEKEEQQKDLHYSERHYGAFQRTVELPSYVDPERVDATFKAGVLKVSVAKRPDAKPRRIPLKSS